MTSFVGFLGNSDHIVPKLFALSLCPTIVPLENWNDELGDAVNNFCEWPVYGFHLNVSESSE